MSNRKMGRNDPCPCGSGKKFKHCCLVSSAKKPADSVVIGELLDERVHEAAMSSLEQDEKSVLDAIARLEAITTRTDITTEQKQTSLFALAQTYQRRGEHQKAIKTLNQISVEPSINKDRLLPTMIKNVTATSYGALGAVKEACQLFEETLGELDELKAEPRTIAFVCMEAGKAFSNNGNEKRAREYWERAFKYAEGKDDEIEMYARAKANLGFQRLHDSDETIQALGVQMVEESSELKRSIGDLEGLSSNYCNLGLYYFREKRFERAIAFMRMDLQLSRTVGDLRSIGTSLCNLSGIYGDLKQFSSARKLLAEAEDIGKKLDDEQLIAMAKHNRNRIEELGKLAGKANEKIGAIANCACGSGKEYQNCCGRADVEPVDIPMQFGGIAEDLDDILHEIKQAGGEPSRLDYILRKIPQSKQRWAWSRLHNHDGWLEMKELPDMASHHLIAARILAKESAAEAGSVTKPLSCVILAACALEAFANQVAFFLHETKSFYEGKLHTIPSELAKDVMEFQRRTELTLKFDILGKALCGNHWPPSALMWTDFKNLIYIRNELVHFKAEEYEQVVPRPKQLHEILRRVPASVKLRDTPHSWPMRLLTPSFADWAVSVAEGTVDNFKDGYKKARIGKA